MRGSRPTRRHFRCLHAARRSKPTGETSHGRMSATRHRCATCSARPRHVAATAPAPMRTSPGPRKPRMGCRRSVRSTASPAEAHRRGDPAPATVELPAEEEDEEEDEEEEPPPVPLEPPEAESQLRRTRGASGGAVLLLLLLLRLRKGKSEV